MTEELSNTNRFKIDDFEFDPTGLNCALFPAELSFEAWERIGEFIRLTNVASQWWWGDWLNLGEDVFGEKSSQALEVTKWDETTLRVYAWVCRKVPLDKRLTGVPFSHYLLLAKLPEVQQTKWANKIVENQWSQRQLKRALRDSQDVEPMQPCVLVRCGTDDEATKVELWAEVNHLEVERCERVKK